MNGQAKEKRQKNLGTERQLALLTFCPLLAKSRHSRNGCHAADCAEEVDDRSEMLERPT